VQSFEYDPLKSHAIHTESFYKTKNGAFKNIAAFDHQIDGTGAQLRSNGYIVNDAAVNFNFSTNALGKYGYSFVWE